MEQQRLNQAHVWLEAGGQAVRDEDYERALGCAALAAYHAVDTLCIERLGSSLPWDGDEEMAAHVARADERASELALQVLEVSSGYTGQVDPDRRREPEPEPEPDDWTVTETQALEVLRDAKLVVDHVATLMGEHNGSGQSPV